MWVDNTSRNHVTCRTHIDIFQIFAPHRPAGIKSSGAAAGHPICNVDIFSGYHCTSVYHPLYDNVPKRFHRVPTQDASMDQDVALSVNIPCSRSNISPDLQQFSHMKLSVSVRKQSVSFWENSAFRFFHYCIFPVRKLHLFTVSGLDCFAEDTLPINTFCSAGKSADLISIVDFNQPVQLMKINISFLIFNKLGSPCSMRIVLCQHAVGSMYRRRTLCDTEPLHSDLILQSQLQPVFLNSCHDPLRRNLRQNIHAWQIPAAAQRRKDKAPRR